MRADGLTMFYIAPVVVGGWDRKLEKTNKLERETAYSLILRVLGFSQTDVIMGFSQIFLS